MQRVLVVFAVLALVAGVGAQSSQKDPLPGTPLFIKVAQDDGTNVIVGNDFIEGAREGLSSQIRKCSEWDGIGSKFILKVVMGDTTDYYRPADSRSTVCDILSGRKEYLWAYDLSKGFNKVPHSLGTLGGSSKEWPRNSRLDPLDNRAFLSQWGGDGSGDQKGGCCASKYSTSGDGEWGQAFQIFVGDLEAMADPVEGDGGLAGLSGETGDPGDIGLNGARGRSGFDGAEGKPGKMGSSGLNGRDGVKGPIGNVGLPGKPGLEGNPGTPGVRGPKGPMGDDGREGKAGMRGKMGPAGEVGDTGTDGDQGPRGPRGFQGERGKKGSRGENGIAGLRGDPGMPGEKGESGNPGEDADFTDAAIRQESLRKRVTALMKSTKTLEFVLLNKNAQDRWAAITERPTPAQLQFALDNPAEKITMGMAEGKDGSGTQKAADEKFVLERGNKVQVGPLGAGVLGSAPTAPKFFGGGFESQPDLWEEPPQEKMVPVKANLPVAVGSLEIAPAKKPAENPCPCYPAPPPECPCGPKSQLWGYVEGGNPPINLLE